MATMKNTAAASAAPSRRALLGGGAVLAALVARGELVAAVASPPATSPDTTLIALCQQHDALERELAQPGTSDDTADAIVVRQEVIRDQMALHPPSTSDGWRALGHTILVYVYGDFTKRPQFYNDAEAAVEWSLMCDLLGCDVGGGGEA